MNMTSFDFVFWLKGFCELNPNQTTPTPEQWRLIRNKLADVSDQEIIWSTDDGSTSNLPLPPWPFGTIIN